MESKPADEKETTGNESDGFVLRGQGIEKKHSWKPKEEHKNPLGK